MLQIDVQDYWLWVAYEPYLDVCLSMHLSRMLPVLSAIAPQVWKKTSPHRWRKLVQRRMEAATTTTLRLWYRMEEPDGEVHPAYQGQDRVF
jgi:hypothetical protein